YPGLGCGLVLRPQFAQAVLYSQAQYIAFYKATHVPQVTGPLVKTAEAQAVRTIRDNFVQPTVNAFGYTLDQFTLRWVAQARAGEWLRRAPASCPASAGRVGGLGRAWRPTAQAARARTARRSSWLSATGLPRMLLDRKAWVAMSPAWSGARPNAPSPGMA